MIKSSIPNSPIRSVHYEQRTMNYQLIHSTTGNQKKRAYFK